MDPGPNIPIGPLEDHNVVSDDDSDDDATIPPNDDSSIRDDELNPNNGHIDHVAINIHDVIPMGDVPDVPYEAIDAPNISTDHSMDGTDISGVDSADFDFNVGDAYDDDVRSDTDADPNVEGTPAPMSTQDHDAETSPAVAET